MPSPEETFRELEDARATREAEVRLLQNLAAAEQDEERAAALRRSLVLVTYAHLEGFCKVAMDMYATVVNSMKIRCSDASSPLVAATLHRVFVALRNTQSKHPDFGKVPVDDGLHTTWREQQFIEKVDALLALHVEIPDEVVNTEMNLSPEVLKRNMYKLGLKYGAVDTERGTISKLLGKRNQIAHGEMVVPTQADVDEFATAAFKVMQFVQGEIFDALDQKLYNKVAAE